MITILTGGTGGAKFVEGVSQVLAPEDITLIVNTGDDLIWWGLHVSPDLDSITYMLAGLLSQERGWGVEADTFHCLHAAARLGAPSWFQLGDRDLATHLVRTDLLAAGKTLSQATEHITHSLGIASRVLPMTDSPVQTRVMTPQSELSFQEYFVRERYQPPVRSISFVGAEAARPAPGVIEAIESAEAVLLAPSNPITSIGPILAVPGIREALLGTRAPVGAVSPLVGGAAVSGPAGSLMRAQGLPVSLEGLASAYGDFLDVLIVDSRDVHDTLSMQRRDIRVHATNILMKSSDDKMELAREALAAMRALPVGNV